MKNRSFYIPPIPSVLLAIISVQLGAVFAKGMFSVLGPWGTSSLRIGFSAVILMCVFRPNLKKITIGQWKAVIPYGLCLGGMNLVFYMAIEKVPVGLVNTLSFIGPLVIAVLGSRRMQDYLWVLLAATGIALVAPWSNTGLDPLGLLLSLLAGAFYAGYIVTGSRVSKVMNDGTAVTIGMLLSALLILPFGLAGGGLVRLTPGLIGIGAVIALLSSCIPFILEMKALRQLPPKTFSILLSLEPAVASLTAFFLLQEKLSLLECAAVVCVVVASVGASLTAKKDY